MLQLEIRNQSNFIYSARITNLGIMVPIRLCIAFFQCNLRRNDFSKNEDISIVSFYFSEVGGCYKSLNIVLYQTADSLLELEQTSRHTERRCFFPTLTFG